MSEYYNKYYEGIFWIPENEKYKIIGTLFIDKEGKATISSLQPLIKYDKPVDWGRIKIDTIFGYINGNNVSGTHSVKFYNAYNTSQSFGGLNKYQYISQKVLVSDFFDKDICEKNYNSIMFNAQILNDWINITGFKDNEVFTKKFKVNQVYEKPEDIDLFTEDHLHIYINFRATAGYPIKRKTYIKEEVYINIKTKDNKSFDELIYLQKNIERLFNILLFYPFSAENIDVRSLSNKIYKWLFKPKEKIFYQKNEIKFNLFKEQSTRIFDNWFKKQKKLELIINNFFSVFGQKGIVVENKFLTYVSILENYHRNNFSIETTKKILSKYNIFKIRKYKGIETPNFQQRLICVIDQSPVSSKIDNLKKYTEILRDTRDYHIHLLDVKGEKSLTWQEINKANQLLEFVIREIFIKELGIKDFNQKMTHLPIIKVADLKLNSKKEKK